ncbi:b(0,+)-type amino acid transporter 1-like isoform X2 [Hydractinia symbiolongicarpus]|uniref:b(0,+)-type amino acid transporter 1-like isoform X2 n=1 Tax=Hydractinia symbiolongicarpus TaxID=13093 RepID=UPI00254E7506|nr:b(0,+)-type amino acid transporter 1-like isoform X2 [Hydractinia symbiolongicarpus]
MKSYSPRDDFSSPEFSSERRAMKSPEFPHRPGHDPFGDNYIDNDDAESEISSNASGEQGKVGLKREVSFAGCLSLVVGVMIGSGIFATPAVVFKNAGSVGMGLLSWVICGFICILASLCYIELGTMIPTSGGEKTYLSEAFGELAGFLYSWTAILIVKPAAIAGVSMAFANYVLEPFFPGCQSEHVYLMKMVASVGIGIIVFVNCASVRWATSVQVIFTATKLLAIVMLIITGFVRLGQGHNDSLKDAFNGTSKSISDIGYAFYGGLWAYDGWNNLNYVTEELKNPIRDLPLAIMIGIPLVTACYVMVNITYLTVLTSIQIASSKAVAVTLANQLYGVMAWVIPVFVACSTFGAANGSAFTSGRLVYVSAREGHMPKLLAMVHTKRHTPLPALIFTCIIAWIMLIPESSNFSTLVNYFNFAAWTFYGGTVAALLWLRIRQPDLERPYKVFIGIPIVVLLCSLYLVIAPFYDYPLQSLYCLLFILFGIPVYFLFVKYQVFPKAITTGFDKITYKIQMLCDLSMPDDFDED